jgi:ribonuclease HII
VSARAIAEPPNLEYESGLQHQGLRHVAGVDEVGRGSWAGPIVAAAVILPARSDDSRLDGVRDSKALTARRRAELFDGIIDAAMAVGIGWASHHVIDARGIAAANRGAMLRAIRNLPVQPDALLVDHVRLPSFPGPQIALPRGDATCLSIAAASIVAKVVRDRWMERWSSRFPPYGFAENKGYGTRAHVEALERHGPCPLHRRSFAPVAVWSL